eukprot:3254338-Rhodomonas_salina.2
MPVQFASEQSCLVANNFGAYAAKLRMRACQLCFATCVARLLVLTKRMPAMQQAYAARPRGSDAWRTPRNQMQETAISVQFVPGKLVLVFDFGVYGTRQCWRCSGETRAGTASTSECEPRFGTGTGFR